MVITQFFKHEMHVCWTVWVAAKLFQKLTNGSVVRNGVGYWGNGLEPEDAVTVTAHDTTAVRTVTIRMLHIIVTRGIRLPDINLHILDRLTIHVLQCADNKKRLAFSIVRHQIALGHLLSLVGVEWSEDGTLSGSLGLRVVDRVD